MGSSTANQQQQLIGQQKTQKGWLSRWTRKQWSRHWFVLKNGSLTYYRGPAAELCSFLDGVLDLSLIKHIEVPQQEEQVVLGHHHAHHHHPHHHYHHFSQIAPPVVNFNGANPATQAQQDQQHFNFSLKMWNGECHLLSASSSSERQLWLAAINSCNNYDDETASSDSSSSSHSSNISTKSADIGSSHHTSCAPHQVAALQQASLTSPHEVAAGRTTSGAVSNTADSNLTYQQQQQQDKEAEISLEQLAQKLKSVVRRRRDADDLEEAPPPSLSGHHRQESHQQQQQQMTLNNNTVWQKPTNPSQRVQAPAAKLTSQQAQHNNQLSKQLTLSASDAVERVTSAESCVRPTEEPLGPLKPILATSANDDEQQQAHKRRLLCPQSPETVSPTSQIMQVGDESSPTGQISLDGRSSTSHESAEAGQQRQKKRVTFDLSNKDIESSSAASPSSSSASSPSSSSSEEDNDDDDVEEEAEEDDELDEDEDDDAATSSLSSISAATSDSESESEDEPADRLSDSTRVPPVIEMVGSPANSSVETRLTSGAVSAAEQERYSLSEFAGIKRIEMRRQLKQYSKQKVSSYEDEDSTCELVRRMIERRKMRLQKKDGATSLDSQDQENKSKTNIDHDADNAISSTGMETNQDHEDENEDEEINNDAIVDGVVGGGESRDRQREMRLANDCNAAAELLTKQAELEMRLESAEMNAELLEKRLSDSYQSYNQLEMSYKQLQLELLECRELNVKNMAEMQAKIDQLTSELKSSELRLLEARERLLAQEEHLARWQLSGERRPTTTDGPSESSKSQTTSSSRRAGGNNWLTKNYSNSMLMNSSNGNKLLMNIAQNLNSQQALLVAGGPSQVIHQMKQSLSINQQQLSLKLLSQSKQIQRKLNELELKVDKIQKGGSGNQSSSSSNNNNNNNHHLTNFNHQTVMHATSSSATPLAQDL